MPASAVAILRLFRVGGRRITAFLLNATTPISAFGGFLAANALAAAIASLIGVPFMLFDASITRIVANPPTAAPAGTTERLSGGSPFSVTFT